MTAPVRPDANTVVAALARDRVELTLGTFDLCCLAALHLRAERDRLASIDEDALMDLFEQVSEVVDPGPGNPRKQATHAIQRLREQRMLARVDGGGVARMGEYTLTRLAAAVVEFFLADEVLTRESLTLLTGRLIGELAEVKGAAAKARTPDDWALGVIGPLRVTVGDLVGGIERRQRGLDAAQEQVRAEISHLLQTDWFGAVDRAQALLETTSDTLAELNAVLLRDTHKFVALLQELHDLAEAAQVDEAQEAAQRVIEQVDRISLWGEARQRAWSEYYQYVHRFLRDVVRLDPDRALSQRLRDQLAGFTGAPFHLVVAHAPSIRLLRDVHPSATRPPVLRAREDREHEPDSVAPGEGGLDLEERVREALAAGARTLSEVTASVLVDLPPAHHFGAAGRVAALVARLSRVRAARERPWVAVDEALQIEQWTVDGGER